MPLPANLSYNIPNRQRPLGILTMMTVGSWKYCFMTLKHLEHIHFGCPSYRFFFGVRAGRDTCLFCLHTLSLSVGATDKSLSPPPVLENSVLCSKIGRSKLLANTTQCSYKKDGGNVPGVRMGVLGSERISELEVPETGTWRARTRASTCIQ